MSGVVALLFANGEVKYPAFSKSLIVSAVRKTFIGVKNKICILSYGNKIVESVFSRACGIDIFGDTIILRSTENEFHPLASTENEAKALLRKWFHLAARAVSMNELGPIKYKLNLVSNTIWFSDNESFFTGILDLDEKKYSIFVNISGIHHCIINDSMISPDKISAFREECVDFLGKKINDENFQDWCNFCQHISTTKKFTEANFDDEKIKNIVSKFTAVICIYEDKYFLSIGNMKIYYHPQIIKISFDEKFFYNLSACPGKTYTDKIISALRWISDFCDLNVKNNSYFPECRKMEISETEIIYS
jgi:hypothetical protein